MGAQNAAVTVALGAFPAIISSGLRYLLALQGFQIVGADLTITDLSELVALERTRVVLVDDSPEWDSPGFSQITQDRKARIVVIVHKTTRPRYLQLLDRGATVCLPIDASAADIGAAVEAAAIGSQIVAPIGAARSSDENGNASSLLTRREKTVLALIRCGHSNAEIALKLCVGTETVRTHAAHIYKKLDVRGRGELLSASVLESSGLSSGATL